MSTLSVIVANYNHAKLLPRALDAMLAQAHPPLEIIVIDDGSRDDSEAVMAEYARRSPLIHAVKNDGNRGVAYTMNRGVEMARGDLVYLAAADDQVLPGFFGRACRLMTEHAQAGLVFGQMVMTNESGKALSVFRPSAWIDDCFIAPEQYLHDYLERELPNFSVCAATIYRRNAFLEAGAYRESLGHWMDTFASRRIGLQYGACYIAAPVMNWFVFESGLARSTPMEKSLAIARRAAELMRSPEHRAVFPESHVANWERAYRLELHREVVRKSHPRMLRWADRLGGWRLRDFIVDRLAKRAAQGAAPNADAA